MPLFRTSHIRVDQCYLRRTDANWTHVGHVHRDLNELFLVLRGCLSVATPHGTMEGHAHHAVVYPKGLVHRPTSRSKEPLEVIGLAWTGEVSSWEMPKLVQHDSLGRLRHQLMWMLDSSPTEQTGADRVLDILGQSVVLEFNRLYSSEGFDLMVRVRRFMRENLERPLELDDLARAAGLNRCYFSRAFKKAEGESPMRALTNMRIEAARDLLLCTTLPLKYIAAKTGFANEVHLAHTFRRIVGRAPGSFRRRDGGRAGDDRHTRME